MYEESYGEAGGSKDPNPLKVGHTFEMLPHPRIDKPGMSPLQLNYSDIVNLHDERQAWGLVSPPHSAVVYRLHDIHTVFLALLLIQVRNAVTRNYCRDVFSTLSRPFLSFPSHHFPFHPRLPASK